MSRIGKLPVEIPSGVEVQHKDSTITVKGPLGTLVQAIDASMGITVEDGVLLVERPTENKRHKALHGLYRTLIQNMIDGVTKGYEKQLRIEGVGYRASKSGKDLTLQVGHSHPVVMTDPEGITVEVPSATEIVVKGIDKQLVGNYAAKIRAWREPEPYKGKGIRYADERVRRKEGKSGS